MLTGMKRRSGLVAFGVLVMVFVGGHAYGALSAREGGAIGQVVVVRNDLPTTLNSTDWADLPGATATVSGPGMQLVLARFSAESYCTGAVGGYCSVRILARGEEMHPKAGCNFAFDSVAAGGSTTPSESTNPGAESPETAATAASSESQSMDRSIVRPGGQTVVKVQVRSMAGAADFRLDDWSLTVERAPDKGGPGRPEQGQAKPC